MIQCFANSECAFLHKTVNMVVFFFKNNENTYPNGRALMQMYRVVLQTKRSYSVLSELLQMLFHKSKNNTIMKPRRKAFIFK